MAGVLAVEELSGIFRHHKLEEFGALRNERVHQKENNPGICAPVGALEPSRFRCGPRQHILAVIMLYERLRREEFLRDNC
jgi:hypothetical protein